jgi:hypothetical protein
LHFTSLVSFFSEMSISVPSVTGCYVLLAQVALLEVNRNEEFAPIKNGVGEGVPDTAETARDMVLALQNRLSSTPAEAGQDDDENTSSLLRAYICGI